MRPAIQVAQPDAEDQVIEHLVGDEVDDPFPDTWPDPDEEDDQP